MRLSDLIKSYRQFFFAPIAPTSIALTRICLGLLLLQSAALHMSPDFLFYYGKHSIFAIDTIVARWWQLDPQFDLMLLFPQEDPWKYAFLWLFRVAIVFFLFGFCTRFSTIVTFLCLLSFHRQCPFNINGGDSMMRLIMFLMCFSNAGDAFSIDSLRRGLKQDWRKKGFAPPKSAPWAQRMIQLQLAMAYFATFCFKISGQKWVDGSACYYATRMQEFIRVPLIPIFDNPIALKILSWYTLFIEGALGTLIWIKEYTYWILLGGLILHAGIDLHINLPVFEWTFVSIYMTFIDPKDLSKLMDKIKALIALRFGPCWQLTYDGNCIFCVRAIGLVHRLDIFGKIQLIDFRDPESIVSLTGFDTNRAEHEMLLFNGKTWSGGFNAFRTMSFWLPLTWPIIPFLYIPGFSWLGDLTYRFIANHRYVFLGGHCQSNACAVPN